jgi:hypothetical protein
LPETQGRRVITLPERRLTVLERTGSGRPAGKHGESQCGEHRFNGISHVLLCPASRQLIPTITGFDRHRQDDNPWHRSLSAAFSCMLGFFEGIDYRCGYDLFNFYDD